MFQTTSQYKLVYDPINYIYIDISTISDGEIPKIQPSRRPLFDSSPASLAPRHAAQRRGRAAHGGRDDIGGGNGKGGVFLAKKIWGFVGCKWSKKVDLWWFKTW